MLGSALLEAGGSIIAAWVKGSYSVRPWGGSLDRVLRGLFESSSAGIPTRSVVVSLIVRIVGHSDWALTDLSQQ